MNLTAYAWDARNMGDSALPNHAKKLLDGNVFNWWDGGRDAIAVVQWVKSRQRGASGGAGAGRNFYVGVGHSFGGCHLLMAEQLSPGTFDALILIEPIIFSPDLITYLKSQQPTSSQKLRPHAVMALKRRSVFESRQQALDSFKSKLFFSRWTDETLKLYVGFGIEEFKDVNANGLTRFRLKCTPEQEAATFTGGTENNTQKVYQNLPSISCPVRFLVGEFSEFAAANYIADGRTGLIREQVLAGKVQRGTFLVVKSASHMVPVEQPEVVAKEIVKLTNGLLRTSNL
ncbi:hypothetical protein HDU76_002581 [Blyttiomyces sp. JEL0837]|nr:hypothetical protein HDU76_002581 [Blyttiomyces sp. JEL0837]